MAITRSVEFYCGRRNKKVDGFFGPIDWYEFSKDIAYTDEKFNEVALMLRSYMKDHNIKIGYCDISTDFGGGYSLFKRYTFVNKDGKFITKKIEYDY